MNNKILQNIFCREANSSYIRGLIVLCVVYIEREKRGPNAESETPSTGYPVLGVGWGGGQRSLTEPFIEGIVTRKQCCGFLIGIRIQGLIFFFTDPDPDPE